MTKPSALADRISLDAHNATLTRHFTGADGATFRVVVRINAYRHQSSAVLSRWDGAAWQTVAAIDGPDLSTYDAADRARIRKTFTAAEVEYDVARLMAEGAFITGGWA